MSRWLPWLGLAALAGVMACVFQPDLSRFPRCDEQGTCPSGSTCLMPEGVCLPDCGERGVCPVDEPSDAGGGDTDAGTDGGDAVPPPLAFAPDALAVGLETESYFHRFQANGGTPPYTFSTPGELPPGLSLNARGELSGKPTRAGDFRFTVEVVDQGPTPQRSSQEHSLHIRPLLRLAGPIILADAVSGSAYVEQVSATGGQPPYRFELVPGSTLPSGLVLQPDGKVEGTTDKELTVAFEVRVTDSHEPPQVAVRTLSLTTGPCSAPCVRTRSVPEARVGTPYSYTLRTSSPPWRLEDGTLPPGLTLNVDTGVISGTPQEAGPYPPFTVSASSLLNKQQVQLTLKVH
jgi:hypothetical protein